MRIELIRDNKSRLFILEVTDKLPHVLAKEPLACAVPVQTLRPSQLGLSSSCRVWKLIFEKFQQKRKIILLTPFNKASRFKDQNSWGSRLHEFNN